MVGLGSCVNLACSYTKSFCLLTMPTLGTQGLCLVNI
jgi:hypothetical protein